MVKLTYEFVKNVFDKRDYILISTEYINNNQDLQYICKKHPNDIKTIKYIHFQRGQGCKECASEHMSNQRKLPFDKVAEMFKERNLILVSKESDYKNNQSKLQYKCPYHLEHEQKITYANLYQGNGCYYCGIDKIKQANAYDLDTVKHELEKRNLILKSDTYKTEETLIKFICKHHEELGEQEKTFGSILTAQYSCKYCRHIRFKNMSKGENNYNWKGGIYTSESEAFRKTSEFKQWRKQIFIKDNFQCVICQKLKGLNAHHLNGYNWSIEERLDIDNGVTLCEGCHNKFHKEFGYGDNTKEQFICFVQKCKE